MASEILATIARALAAWAYLGWLVRCHPLQ